ncbi:MAG: adenylate/guanylate cyclase domain-containing protein [Proteobacteria bacterium]|nr:adenylate/guanylate cyclase domain-containing protein [Pseudomonadota bacterium]
MGDREGGLGVYVPRLAARVREHGRLEFEGAAMFAGLSGFTALGQKLAPRGAAGAEELSRILDRTFGTLLDLIDEHGGDVVRLAGDAALAVFPSDGALDVAAARAVTCALAAQEALDGREEATATLRLKIGLGAGSLVALDLEGDEAATNCSSPAPPWPTPPWPRAAPKSARSSALRASCRTWRAPSSARSETGPGRSSRSAPPRGAPRWSLPPTTWPDRSSRRRCASVWRPASRSGSRSSVASAPCSSEFPRSTGRLRTPRNGVGICSAPCSAASNRSAASSTRSCTTTRARS